MAVRETVKSKLQSNLTGFSALTRQLMEVVVAIGDMKPGTGQQTQLSTVLDKLIERDREIQQLTETALEMRSRQKEIDRVDIELDRRSQEIRELQSRLQDAEKILELAVYHGKQKLESVKQANTGAVSPEELIRYAHRISQARSTVSPVGWQPSDSTRPYPRDIEMRSGLLGQLTTPVTIEETKASADGTGKKLTLDSTSSSSRVLTGGNQNNNKSEVGQGFRPLRPAVQNFPNMTFGEAETMSEDSSPSSSDEGT